MYTYNLSKYFDINNKFTIVVKKDKIYPPNKFVQPKMVFAKPSFQSNYEHTNEKLKKHNYIV